MRLRFRRVLANLGKMLEYVRCYIRPDGSAPLIGNAVGGQVLPIRQRAANDHAYLLPAAAVAFNDPLLKSARRQLRNYFGYWENQGCQHLKHYQ